MARRRKTTAELERRGAFEKDPQRGRERANEPEPKDGPGPWHADFSNPKSPTSLDLRRCLDDILRDANEVRLTSADTIYLELAARQLYRCRRSGARSSDFGQLDRYLGKLGLNPADRSRVQGKGKTLAEEASEWDDLANGKDGLPVQ